MGKFRFIDLFAGLGGFHLALSRLGGECVFASEIKPKLRKLYKQNFPGTPIFGDITQIDEKDIPEHEVLCGGFPCQPFSHAGKELGFDDEEGRGNMFMEICRVLRHHKPKYIFLENVQPLMNHDEGNTWRVISDCLDELHYDIRTEIFSPHQFGIPQHRPRFYIVGMLRDENGVSGMEEFCFPKVDPKMKSNVRSIVDEGDTYGLHVVRPQLCEVFDIWQEFVEKTVEREGEMPNWCVKSWEFGADYDFEGPAPAFQSVEQLKGKKGSFGHLLQGETKEELLQGLPSTSQKTTHRSFPETKKILIRQNREFYERNKDWLDDWKKKLEKFPRTQQSFEWSADQCDFDIHEHVVQLRPSGVRVRRMNYVPTITLCTTSTPIFPFVKVPYEGTKYSADDVRWGRYISPMECARIQSMHTLKYTGLSVTQQIKALGNAVNVDVVEMIARQLLKDFEE